MRSRASKGRFCVQGRVAPPLPPASTEVRQIMAEMATTAEHDEAVVNALHETGFEAEELAENAALSSARLPCSRRGRGR